MRPGAISSSGGARFRGTWPSRTGSADGSGSRDGGSSGDGISPLIGTNVRLPGVDLADLGQQRLRVRVIRRANSSADGALSTTRPRYITTTRSEMNLTTPRSWLMNRYVRLSALFSSMNRFSTCAWIETSSAATDSSHTRNSRLDRERARDADARALAAGELVRIAAHQRRIEADAIQHQADVLDLLRAADHVVRDRRLADDVHHAHARIERRVRILEDHLHLELLPARRGGVQAARATRPARSARPPTAAAGPRPGARAWTCRSRTRRPARRPRPAPRRGRRCRPRGRPPPSVRRRTRCRSCAARSSDLTKRFDTPFSSTSGVAS